MIAKAVARKTKGHGFGGLARYVGNERKMAAVPGGWGATAAYIVDAGHDGAKVAPGSVRITNCASETLPEAIEEIELTQARCKGGKADQTYHLVISFPPGEVPTRAQLENIEDGLVKAIGLDQHQRMSAIHTDKDHLHIHVAINKVHPESYRNITPHRDHPKLMAGCERLEIEHGLTRTHGERVRMPDGTELPAAAADLEAHTGQESLLGWAREHAKADLLAASGAGKGWQDLHEAAAAHGLELRPRGAGLVLAVAAKPRLAVKASDVDRSLSMKALTGRLGLFEPSKQTQGQPQGGAATQDGAQGPPGDARSSTAPPGAKPGYTRDPKQRSPEFAELVDRFKQGREAAKTAREAALGEIKQRRQAERDTVRAQAAERRRAARVMGTSRLRRDAERQRRHEQMRASMDGAARERTEARDRHRAPDWFGFLQNEAQGGNEKALKLLRQVERRRREIEMNLLHAADLSEGRSIVMQGVDKSVGKTGTVFYRTRDGGTVQDRARAVGVAQVTASSALLGLILASERFDRPLTVKGTDAFKVAVAAAAAMPGVSVTFADPAMEALRQEAVRAREEARKRGPATPTWLVVPFADKDEVMKRGAEWDRERKQWFVPAGIDPDALDLGEWVAGQGRYSDERTYLDVPYAERGDAKLAGARFDGANKAWFVPPGHDLNRVRQWMPAPAKASQGQPVSPAAAYVAGRNEAAQIIPGIQEHKVWDKGTTGGGTFRGIAELPDGSKAVLIEKDAAVHVIPTDSLDGPSAWIVGQTVELHEDGRVEASRSKGRSR